MHTESSLGWGGQEIRILTEARGMQARGHRLTLLTPAAARIHAEAPKYGVEAIAVPIARKRPAALFALRRRLGELRPDVVNTHSSTDSWLAALGSRLPIVRTRHISAAVGVNPWNRWLYGSARKVVTTGEALRRELLERLALQEKRVVSVPTGIDLRRFDRASARPAREALGIPPGALVFGIAATLRSWKGHRTLLDAFTEVATTRPDAHLLIAGDGPQRPALEERVAGSTLQHRIHLIGQRDDVPDVLAAMDCFVLPSYANEGVPQALMQAMAMALPVITTRVGAIEEAVSEETGVFVPPQDPPALAAAMLALAQSPARRMELGSAARRVAEQRFSLEKMLDAMEAVFAEAAG